MGDVLLVWVDTIVQGVLLGGLYALYATGLSLIFGIMRLVNLAHGDLIVAAAFLILALAEFAGLNTVVAFIIAMPVMFVFGYALQRWLLNRTLGGDILPPLLVTFGLSIVIQNALLQGFSADTQRLPLGSISGVSVPLGGGIAAGIMPLLSLVAAVAVVFGLNQLSYRTGLGRALRATSDDAETAQLMGINNANIYAIAMGLALVVCAIAAFFLGSRSTFDPTTGPARLIYAFEAVIIGGLGSLWGTLAGGIVLGIAQTVGARINPEWQILAGHVAFLVVLIFKPRGFFPRAFD
jgi:branched-chain amino acid transport system permease protein